MYHNVLNNLRRLVAEVEQEQRFEKTMKKSVLRQNEHPKAEESVDLDTLLKSMMVLPSQERDTSTTPEV
jgi:hypothetical protein